MKFIEITKRHKGTQKDTYYKGFNAWITTRGAIAQLGEHLRGTQEVVGSIPTSSTIPSFLITGWPKSL